MGRATIRPVDWAALALLLYEVPSISFSQYRANGIGATEIVALSVLAYFAIRVLIRTAGSAASVASLVGLLGAWLACIGIRQFVSGTEHLSQAGLSDFVAFRALFIHPVSEWVSGENFTLLLLTLPFACAAAAYIIWRLRPLTKLNAIFAVLALLPAGCVLAALLLSLSRAVFWSTLFFFVIACGLMAVYEVLTLRAAALVLAGCFATALLAVGCEATIDPGIFRAYVGHHVSQTRSTEGRLDTWHRSLELVYEYPVWGVGSSNAALFLLSSADEDDSTGFTSRTFSLPVQILVEKGLVGFVCYAGFLLLAGLEFHRGMRLTEAQIATPNRASPRTRPQKPGRKNYALERLQAENALRAMKCIFAAGLAAVLLRELTYSSLLEHAGILALALVLAALMCIPAKPSDLNVRPLAIGIGAAVLAFQWPYWNYVQADAKLQDFFSQVASADFANAKDSIDEAIRLWPWNARYYGWRGYVESQQLPSQCLGVHGAALRDHDRQAAMEAAKDYRHSLQLNDRDAVVHHNLAWLEHLLGNNEAANQDWKESVELDPGNAAFHVSYGMFLDEMGSTEATRTQYEAAIELTPSILDSQFFTRYRSRSPQAADALVKDASAKLEARLGSGNDPILEARLGKLYLIEGNTSRADRLLNDAARQLPNLPLVWFNLGEFHQTSGDVHEARSDYRKASTIDPSLAGPYLQTGELLLQTGNQREATAYLSQAVRSWEHVNPVTSAHNNRLYDGPQQPIDDLLPTTLVWYISPCEASGAWRALSKLHPDERSYAGRDRTCEQLPAPHLGAS